MPPARRTQLRLGVDRLQAHQPHQPLHPLAVDRLALLDQPLRQPPAAEERVGGVLLVDQPHQPQVLRRLGRRLVVQAGAAQPQQFALPAHAQLRVVGLDQRPQLAQANGPTFFLSHSSSILSRPICSNSSAFWASASAVAALAAVAEDLVGAGEQLLLPGVDQGRVDPVLAGQLVDGLDLP